MSVFTDFLLYFNIMSISSICCLCAAVKLPSFKVKNYAAIQKAKVKSQNCKSKVKGYLKLLLNFKLKF